MEIRSRSELVGGEVLALIESETEPKRKDVRELLEINPKLQLIIRQITIIGDPATLWSIIAQKYKRNRKN